MWCLKTFLADFLRLNITTRKEDGSIGFWQESKSSLVFEFRMKLNFLQTFRLDSRPSSFNLKNSLTFLKASELYETVLHTQLCRKRDSANACEIPSGWQFYKCSLLFQVEKTSETTKSSMMWCGTGNSGITHVILSTKLFSLLLSPGQ